VSSLPVTDKNVSRYLFIATLVIAGEMIFGLPFHTARIPGHLRHFWPGSSLTDLMQLVSGVASLLREPHSVSWKRVAESSLPRLRHVVSP